MQTIENKRRFGNLPGVVVSKELLNAVGNPQNKLTFVHIAGTNGKGSTAAFLREILCEAGIKTGFFTSPHLVDFTERIQVNRERISKEAVVRLGQQLLELKLEVHPTMFDYCLAMALLYFEEQGCQIVILETGLGGRLDSTNVIPAAQVSILTKVGYDHTDVLGETLEEIAAEKAGILKKGTRAVIESQEKPVLEVFQKRCEMLGIPYKIMQKSAISALPGNNFEFEGETYQMQMLGGHQRENASAAILAANELRKLGVSVTKQAIHSGIAKTRWNGRMEIVSKEPFLLMDGAHNGHGVEALVRSLKGLFPGEKFDFIMGVMADKNYKDMVTQILPLAERIITVTPESSRALQSEELAAYIRTQGVMAESRNTLEEAFGGFRENAESLERKRKTIAFGSLYFMGAIRKFFELPF